jgi:hypothetical protein
LLDRHVRAIFRPDVIGARADDLAVLALFDHVRAPAVVRAMTNSGVNIGVGMPIMW